MQKNQARTTRYLFTVGENREVSFNAQTANVADVIMNQAPFPVRHKDLGIPGDKIEHELLNVQLLLSEDLSEYIYFYKWMLKLKNNLSSGNYLDYLRGCELTAIGQNGKSTASFRYTDCFPTNIEGIQYSTIGDDVVLTTNVVFKYNEFKVVTADGEEIDEFWDGEF